MPWANYLFKVDFGVKPSFLVKISLGLFYFRAMLSYTGRNKPIVRLRQNLDEQVLNIFLLLFAQLYVAITLRRVVF